MDADTLRLILFIIGIVLILGIYYFGRKQKQVGRIHAVSRKPEDEEVDGGGDLEEDDTFYQFQETTHVVDPEPVPEKIEPTFSIGLEQDPMDVERDAADQADEDVEATENNELDMPHIKTEYRSAPEQTMFSFTADETETVDSTEDFSDLPQKIIQLNLVTRKGTINGAALKRFCRERQLKYGEMQIFHRFAVGNSKQIVFSMASMVEPGIFPEKDSELEVFETPGVVFFTQLPGITDGLQVFAEMLQTAENMAASFNAQGLDTQVQDDTHNKLSKQAIEHIREEIIEHRRQVQLAQKRR